MAADGPVYRVVMVGSGGVGKSALTLRFMYDEVREGKVRGVVANPPPFHHTFSIPFYCVSGHRGNIYSTWKSMSLPRRVAIARR